MSTLIKIDRNSIKKNKNAGQTTSYIPGIETITFSGECLQEDIDRLEKEKGIHITTRYLGESPFKKISGILDHGQLVYLMPKGFTIDFSNNYETVNHLPISKYSYQHENTEIECNECKQLIQYDEIEKDSFRTEDDDIYFDVCPNCQAHDSFDYEFEPIENALNPVI